MDAVIALVAVVLALGVGLAVAWPLLRRSDAQEDATPADRRERLEEQLEASLRAIREIEQDHLSGGLSDEDFETLNTDERTRAVALMRRLDALNGDEGAKSVPKRAVSGVPEPSGGADEPPSE